MDRSLDEIIGERPRARARPEPHRAPPSGPRAPPRAPRREEYPRDGVRKYRREDPVSLESDWVHDRFEEDRYDRDRLQRRPPPDLDDFERPSRPQDNGVKIRVDNLHYELNQDDLRGLFQRMGPLLDVRILYDRMDRSEGTAFITYEDPRDAKRAVAEFDGCHARGLPIKLTLLPTAPAAVSKGTLFDRVERPSRSLFDRIEGGPDSRDASRDDVDRRRRNRSDSPRRRPPPEGVDRYVPGERRLSRSPIRRRGTPRETGRRPGQRRDNGGGRGGRRARSDDDNRPMVGGRPKKTAEELDAEMEDYFGKSDQGPKTNGAAVAVQNGNGGAALAAVPADDDIDMIE